MNLGMYIERSARFWPDRPAILFRDQSLSYRDLAMRANRLANALRALGLRKGDRVAIVSPNRPEIVECECAFYQLGLVKVALNARLAPAELQDALANAEPVAVIAGPEHLAMAQAASVGLESIMGRMHAGPGDVLALCGPITHASGMFIQPMLYQGAAILLLERFHPAEFLEAIEKHRVTSCFLVPAMVHALLAEPSIRTRDLSSLKLVSYGAAPMSPARIREAWQAFGPVLAQGYGAAETTGGVISLSIEDHARAMSGERPDLLTSCGRPSCESDVQVLDAEGRPVHEGYIHIVDRRKEMLVSGGFNVYPSEVESVLAQHPAVYEVCVIGVPDDRWGEAVKAVAVLRQGQQASEQDLMDFCRGRLADFKRPRSVDFMAQLPKNSNGKLSRKDVREPYWRGRERRVN